MTPKVERQAYIELDNQPIMRMMHEFFRTLVKLSLLRDATDEEIQYEDFADTVLRCRNIDLYTIQGIVELVET